VDSEILPDESQATTSAVMTKAIAVVAAHGVKIQRVMTDSGSCYRSRAFGHVLCRRRDQSQTHPGPVLRSAPVRRRC